MRVKAPRCRGTLMLTTGLLVGLAAPRLQRHVAPAVLAADRIDYWVRRHVIEYWLRRDRAPAQIAFAGFDPTDQRFTYRYGMSGSTDHIIPV